MYEKIKIKLHKDYVLVSENSKLEYHGGTYSFNILPLEEVKKEFNNKKILELYMDSEQPRTDCNYYTCFEVYDEQEDTTELFAIKHLNDEELEEYANNRDLDIKTVKGVYEGIYSIPYIQRA